MIITQIYLVFHGILFILPSPVYFTSVDEEEGIHNSSTSAEPVTTTPKFHNFWRQTHLVEVE